MSGLDWTDFGATEEDGKAIMRMSNKIQKLEAKLKSARGVLFTIANETGESEDFNATASKWLKENPEAQDLNPLNV